QALLQLLPCLGRNIIQGQNAVVGQKASTADAKFWVILTSLHPLNDLDAGPNAARILPATPRPTDPLTEDGARRHHTPLVLAQRTGQRPCLPCSTHTKRNQRRQEVGRDSQPRSLGDA